MPTPEWALPLLALFLTQLAVTMPMMTAVSLLAQRIRNAGVVDLFWAGGFVMLVGVNLFLAPKLWPALLLAEHLASEGSARALVINGLLLVANLRLCLYLLRRFLKEHPQEDPRYGAFRTAWEQEAAKKQVADVSGYVQRRFFWIFQLQALLMPVAALPVTLATLSPSFAFGFWEYCGLGLFCVGFAGEALADAQLRTFKQNPEHRGLTCQQGLWRYSRHPNYFFEWLMWVSYAVFSLAAPGGWLGLLSPLLMLHFLLNVTGIAATEARAVESRKDYREYQQTTSAFVPWFRRKAPLPGESAR
ncbi:MAG: DUF1295 domain-containing protein [Candidatus Melainabacteria bacterium]|nr:DUF1295 domain-containing protein [Candidatus Melainabacteria bacterium]